MSTIAFTLILCLENFWPIKFIMTLSVFLFYCPVYILKVLVNYYYMAVNSTMHAFYSLCVESLV